MYIKYWVIGVKLKTGIMFINPEHNTLTQGADHLGYYLNGSKLVIFCINVNVIRNCFNEIYNRKSTGGHIITSILNGKTANNVLITFTILYCCWLIIFYPLPNFWYLYFINVFAMNV